MTPPRRSIHNEVRLPDADALVVEILTFFGGDPERLEGFLSSSGATTGDLRAAIALPTFAESLLDHLCSDERLLVPFADAYGYDPASIDRVRQSLAPQPFED